MKDLGKYVGVYASYINKLDRDKSFGCKDNIQLMQNAK